MNNLNLLIILLLALHISSCHFGNSMQIKKVDPRIRAPFFCVMLLESMTEMSKKSVIGESSDSSNIVKFSDINIRFTRDEVQMTYRIDSAIIVDDTLTASPIQLKIDNWSKYGSLEGSIITVEYRYRFEFYKSSLEQCFQLTAFIKNDQLSSEKINELDCKHLNIYKNGLK